jgi:hypothetical protein
VALPSRFRPCSEFTCPTINANAIYSLAMWPGQIASLVALR